MRRAPLTLPLRFLRARGRTLRLRLQHRAEVRRGARHELRADRTPIFILGAPRSGTTLLYQLLVEGLDVGWLANAHMRSPGDVSRIERESRPRAGRDAADYESAHGTTSGDWGPSEGGEFWYRVFPRSPHQLEDRDAAPQLHGALRAMVREFMDACGGPVVFKNVINTLRVPVIAAALPEARFVLIERDLEANARSLLAGRVKRGQLDMWWSAQPKGFEQQLDRTPAEQVVWQVERMNEVARADLGALHPDRSTVVGYPELCADPAAVLERIHSWLVASGSDVALREGARVPPRFERRSGGPLPPELEDALHSAVSSTREDGR